VQHDVARIRNTTASIGQQLLLRDGLVEAVLYARPSLDVSAGPIVAGGVRWYVARLGVRIFGSKGRCAVNQAALVRRDGPLSAKACCAYIRLSSQDSHPYIVEGISQA
jgi:hypothetical protein